MDCVNKPDLCMELVCGCLSVYVCVPNTVTIRRFMIICDMIYHNNFHK